MNLLMFQTETTNRPHFNSVVLGKTLFADELSDLSSQELEQVIRELTEALGMLEARISELQLYKDTEYQEDPKRFGRMRFKASVWRVLLTLLQDEREQRERAEARLRADKFESVFYSIAQEVLNKEDFSKVKNITQSIIQGRL